MLPRPFKVLHNLWTSLLSDLYYIDPFSDVSIKLQSKSGTPKVPLEAKQRRKVWYTCVKVAGHEGWWIGGEEEAVGAEKVCGWRDQSDFVQSSISSFTLSISHSHWGCLHLQIKVRKVGPRSCFVVGLWIHPHCLRDPPLSILHVGNSVHGICCCFKERFRHNVHITSIKLSFWQEI